MSSIRILVVDDEDSIRRRCVRLLARKGFDVLGTADGQSALDLLGKRPFDLVIADIRMPGLDGMELLERVKAADPSVEIVMMTGYAAVETAVKAMKAGARDYLTKPFDVEDLLRVVEAVAERKCLRDEIDQLRRRLEAYTGRPLLVGTSPAMDRVMRFIHKVGPAGCNVLIQGESGTGKELVARSIHANSPRRDRPFVVADCAALSGSVLESELFGHVRGAFTGAHTERKGYFESAAGGTLFLDEVGDLPLDLQGKLLRAVQEQEVVKVGASRPLKVDARIIAATNRDLEGMVARGEFRQDLFYRLNVVRITLPPLRHRRGDIPLLVRHFLKRYAARMDLPEPPAVGPEVLEALGRHDWPGNVRELENAVHRAVVLAEGGEIRIQALLPVGLGEPEVDTPPHRPGMSFQELRREVVRDFTRRYLERSLRHHGGNITRTARALGMRRTSLQRLLRQAGLEGRHFREAVPPGRRQASRKDRRP